MARTSSRRQGYGVYIILIILGRNNLISENSKVSESEHIILVTFSSYIVTYPNNYFDMVTFLVDITGTFSLPVKKNKY